MTIDTAALRALLAAAQFRREDGVISLAAEGGTLYERDRSSYEAIAESAGAWPAGLAAKRMAAIAAAINALPSLLSTVEAAEAVVEAARKAGQLYGFDLHVMHAIHAYDRTTTPPATETKS